MNLVSNINFNEAWENEDYQKLMNSLVKKYRFKFTFDEIESCKMNALYKALNTYDPDRLSKDNKKSTFITHLCNHIKYECLNYCSFLKKDTNTGTSIEYKDKNGYINDNIDKIDLQEELDSIEHGDILIDYYVNHNSLRILSENRGIKRSSLINKKKKALDILKIRMQKCV